MRFLTAKNAISKGKSLKVFFQNTSFFYTFDLYSGVVVFSGIGGILLRIDIFKICETFFFLLTCGFDPKGHKTTKIEIESINLVQPL